MTDVYIDSTLHNEWNIKFNPQLSSALENKGLSVYLPQRDTNQDNRESIFYANKEAIDKSLVIIAVAQNESPNWGVEVAYGYATNKTVIGIAEIGHNIPLMASHMMKDIVKVKKLDDISEYLERFVEIINKYLKL